MKIIAIVLNWNGKQDTLRCLDSLQRVTVEHSVIVIDNGSTDDSVAFICKEYPDVRIIETGRNLGYAEGNNVGIRYALDLSPDYILILNNDTTVDPQILCAFLKRDLPIQGGKVHQMDDPSRLDQLGGTWNPRTGMFDAVAAKALAEQWNEPLVLDYVSGAALFVRSEVFRNVGLFDPRFFLFWEECDWCARAARLGYSSTFCPEAKLNHRGSGSFVGGLPHTTYYWWRNRLLWISLNCSKSDRRKLFLRMIPQVTLILRRYLLKSVLSFASRSNSSRRLRLKTYRAELTGVLDYFRGRFGCGPDWLTSKE